MTKMDPVGSSGQRNERLDGGTEKRGGSTLVVAAVAIAAFAIGAMFYSMSESPTAVVSSGSDDVKASGSLKPVPIPPTTPAQGQVQ